MDPNTQPPPSGGQPISPPQPVNPTPQPQPTPATPPVFHNPLAAGYDAHTEQLPATPTQSVQPPTPPQPAAVPEMPQPAQSITSAPQPEPQQPPSNSPQPVRIPTPVSHLSEGIVKPAPVRLAPEPKADDYHAAAAAQTAGAAPFGSVHTPAPVSQTPAPVPAARKKSPLLLVIGILVVTLIVGGLVASSLLTRKKTTVTTSPSSSPGSKRLTAELPLQPFAQKVSSDCFVFQVPTPNETQTNKDCLFSITYGEQKTSTITVSPQREFDIVATDNSSNSPSAAGQTVRFDTEKYLEALIANSVTKELIVTREKITVGGLEATKVVGKKDANGSPVVAYVFIVLPEGDRQFGEKTFVAFIVTGAYNDDYSRKNFDQALATWSWK